MGGALAMNAGAHGGETWDFVTRFAVSTPVVFCAGVSPRISTYLIEA